MTDNIYISKEKAVAKFIEGDGDDEFTEGYNFAVNEYREKIKAIPAADIQPIRRGHWEDSGNFYFKECSECGSKWDISITDNCFVHYCPRCGARMDGDQNDD